MKRIAVRLVAVGLAAGVTWLELIGIAWLAENAGGPPRALPVAAIGASPAGVAAHLNVAAALPPR
jgi:hypothetical protein